MFAEDFWQPGRMGSDLEHLGRIVRERRESLYLRQDQLALRGGPSTTTQSKVENGIGPAPTQKTKEKLETALRWQPGSVDSILNGGDPTPLPRTPNPRLTPLHENDTSAINAPMIEPSGAPSREFRLLTSQLEVTESLLDAVEVAESDIEVEYARKYLGFAEKMLALIARGTPLVAGDEAEETYVRTVSASERYGAQRLRLGLPVGVDSTTPPAVAEGTWNAAADEMNRLTDESIDRSQMTSSQRRRLADLERKREDLRQSDHALAALRSDEPKGPDPRGLDDGEE